MNIKALDQLVDLIELLLAEADRPRRQVLQNATPFTKGIDQAHEIEGLAP